MKLALAALLAALFGGAPEQNGKVQVLVVGVIKNIDAKAGVLTVTERLFSDRRGRRGLPEPDLGPGFPPPGVRGARGRGQQIDTKIFYSTETAVKSTEKPLTMDDLKVGDSVRVAGTPGNKGLVAQEIERLKAAQ